MAGKCSACLCTSPPLTSCGLTWWTWPTALARSSLSRRRSATGSPALIIGRIRAGLSAPTLAVLDWRLSRWQQQFLGFAKIVFRIWRIFMNFRQTWQWQYLPQKDSLIWNLYKNTDDLYSRSQYECSGGRAEQCGLYPLQRTICNYSQCRADCTDQSPLCGDKVPQQSPHYLNVPSIFTGSDEILFTVSLQGEMLCELQLKIDKIGVENPAVDHLETK